MGRQRIERCLKVAAAYWATGNKAGLWTAANGLEPRARLVGTGPKSPAPSKPRGFVAVCMAPRSAASGVRLKINSAGARLHLHWPLTHLRELAVLLWELGR